MTSADQSIWIESLRPVSGVPMCRLTWGRESKDIRASTVQGIGLDLIEAALYADLMMRLVGIGLPKHMVGAFTGDLIQSSRPGKPFVLGDPETITLTPAGSSKRGQALVVAEWGEQQGELTTQEARRMGVEWLEAAATADTDQLIAEALHTTGKTEAEIEGFFFHLRALRH
jgi:hypothetical protein